MMMHRLAHAGTAEEANLSALRHGLDQVHHLDARLQNLLRPGKLVEVGRALVDGAVLIHVGLRKAVDGFAHDVKKTPADFLTDGHRDRLARGDNLLLALQAVGRVHGDGANTPLAEVLLHLQNEIGSLVAFYAKGVQNVGDAVFWKFSVDDRADDLDDRALNFVGTYFHENVGCSMCWRCRNGQGS